jgi:hypothetical protein
MAKNDAKTTDIKTEGNGKVEIPTKAEVTKAETMRVGKVPHVDTNTGAVSPQTGKDFEAQLQHATAGLQSQSMSTEGSSIRVRVDHTANTSQVKGVNITTTENTGNTTTIREQNYSFAVEGTLNSEDGSINESGIAANPDKKEVFTTIKNDRKRWEKSTVKTSAFMTNETTLTQVQSFESHSVERSGSKTIERTTDSHHESGRRTDAVYGKNGSVYAKGYSSSAYSSPSGSLDAVGTVDVKSTEKGRIFTGSHRYDVSTTEQGTVSYSLRGEAYGVYDPKTNTERIYKREADGSKSGEIWEGAGFDSHKIGDIPVDKQMKKDFERYKKQMDKLVKKAAKSKSSQAYMEATPTATPVTTHEATRVKQSLKYAEEVNNTVATWWRNNKSNTQ